MPRIVPAYGAAESPSAAALQGGAPWRLLAVPCAVLWLLLLRLLLRVGEGGI